MSGDDLFKRLDDAVNALERIAQVLEDATSKDGEPLRVAQSGEWSQVSYTVTP